MRAHSIRRSCICGKLVGFPENICRCTYPTTQPPLLRPALASPGHTCRAYLLRLQPLAVTQRFSQAGEGLFPAFDHAVGDPREAEIHIEAHHRIVLIEGNYVLLGELPSKCALITNMMQGGPFLYGTAVLVV